MALSSEGTAKHSERNNGRYTETRLHPHLVSVALARAPSAEMRAAWLDGLSVDDAPHRVRLVNSRAAKNPNSRSYESHSQDFNVLRRESEQWWEERALEVEAGGQHDFL